ncbi:MAG: hypothetical protein LIP09_12025 [Bacteroidales bacterium]|nr:hypothetical protein [Bacteroidales bacterium]
MKRLTLILTAIIIGIAANCQEIPSAMGIRIGIPKEMFISFFSQNNSTKPTNYVEEIGDEVYTYENIQFQGLTFDRVRFCFINDKLVGAIYDIYAKPDVSDSEYIGSILRICEMQYPMSHFENEDYEWWSVDEYKGVPILRTDRYNDTYTITYGPFKE